MNANQNRIIELIRDVPDWPKPGVVFKDITPLLADPAGFAAAVEELVALAVREMGMTVGEAVWAATAGGARALRRGDVGHLGVGARRARPQHDALDAGQPQRVVADLLPQVEHEGWCGHASAWHQRRSAGNSSGPVAANRATLVVWPKKHSMSSCWALARSAIGWTQPMKRLFLISRSLWTGAARVWGMGRRS